MTEIINALFTWLLNSDYAQYASILVFVCYTLSHAIQYFPIAWTSNIPNWVMVILNVIAAKHGADKAAKTTLAGNKVSGYDSK